MVQHCLIINLDNRTDLWKNLESFRTEWITQGKIVERISGVDYRNKTNVINEFIQLNRLNLNGTGFRHKKDAFLGELGCFMGHYNCWKYIVDQKLDSCLILEDGIQILQHNFTNLTINNELDILFTNEEMKQHNNNLIGYGLQGYIVTQKGAELLLQHCYTLSAPIDLQIRHLCNIKELKWSVLSNPYVKRDHNRVSSIEGIQLNDQQNLNDKQNTSNIIQRLILNLLQHNVNLDDYIE